jgi:hypothetical protein
MSASAPPHTSSTSSTSSSQSLSFGPLKSFAAVVTGVALSLACWQNSVVCAETQMPDARMLRRIRRENTDRSVTTQNFHYYEGAAVLRNFVLLSGNSNPSLCNQIARYLGIQRAPAKVGRRAGGVLVGRTVFCMCHRALCVWVSFIPFTATPPPHHHPYQHRHQRHRPPIAAATTTTTTTTPPHHHHHHQHHHCRRRRRRRRHCHHHRHRHRRSPSTPTVRPMWNSRSTPTAST